MRAGLLHGFQQQFAFQFGVVDIHKKWWRGKLPDEGERRRTNFFARGFGHKEEVTCPAWADKMFPGSVYSSKCIPFRGTPNSRSGILRSGMG